MGAPSAGPKVTSPLCFLMCMTQACIVYPHSICLRAVQDMMASVGTGRCGDTDYPLPHSREELSPQSQPSTVTSLPACPEGHGTLCRDSSLRTSSSLMMSREPQAWSMRWSHGHPPQPCDCLLSSGLPCPQDLWSLQPRKCDSDHSFVKQGRHGTRGGAVSAPSPSFSHV